MVTNRIIFFATSVQPNPEEIDYWVDLSDNPYGGSIKYFNGTEWVRLAASGGTPDLSNYYTKTQVNKLLNDKANISDVDSKVDDEEVKDVIKDIQFNTSNPNGITMVMFKYDGSNDSISLPIASTGSAGIVTSKDFLDFVKQHQLQELHTEMIDTFADIRAKYQKKLIAGLNIEIDQETNVISASGDLAVQWDNITNKPDFKPVATSGDYNDLINKLKPGKDVSISEDNVISIAIDSDSLEQSLATLQSNIDKEAATARAAETKLGNDIATEKNRAQSAEQTISTNLQNEINRSTQVDTQHTNAINKEILDRTQADTTINNNVSSLTNRVKVNEDKLTIINGNESTTGSIANAIKQAKSYTDTTVTAEQTRAEKAEQKLTSDLASEVTRAKGAEYANATAIANEVERATGVEETLNSNITQLQTQKVDKVEGKGLSTNDYTTPEKNKLAAIEAEANKYVLPAATASALGGVKIGSNITLANGGTISITKANVTSALGVDPTTTYVKKAGDTMTGSLFIETTSEINLYNTISVPSSSYAVLRLKSGDNYWDVTTKGTGGLLLQKQGASDVQLKLDTSGNVSIPGYFKSTVATGTAPIRVSSTTLCTNLNADMVDGVDVKDIEHTLYIQSTTKNYLKIQVNHKYFPNSYKVVEYHDGYIYVYQLLINAYSPEFTDLQLISGKVPTEIKTFYDLTKWYIETTESGMNIYIYQPENSNFKIYGVIHGEPESPNVQFSVVSSLPSNVVSRHITFNVTSQNLEEFDWYGVSWSETSSNPNCTRIGNMDMHRSLPIQSMMKGYLYFKDGNPLYRMLKLNDSWTKCENYSAGGWRDVGALLEDNNINVMIKIPEFWWIDDYIESTETHNLKICPHAKPGWHHHKEAYVSAYEGYINGNYYRSSKNKIPSVNFTRSTVRPKARANGLGNSWNIYTYNEHRAICHLFLIEYATRNSQKAVNTALTVEGFRQGGLGSGCTTGTVTINGARTFSFIPTGSSDSLGSGSGEVTVTIQQTDSSGSNTTTTTRKCNRYRGIENPFGHVWKHTDDVISVYISGYSARFWYKCDSPDHFGDSILNDNPYYKNIAANAVVTGYKTKIVTTSTCDFFALSCNNGSETTYWCDYNWDNTDGLLHCLLIGGYCGDGGGAGLFYIHSDNVVNISSTAIGSRLTYLPWAE